MIKVRIDKAEKGFWYENQIGNTLTLHENSGINNCRYTFYEDLNIKLEINESDCTVIQEEEPVLGDIKALQELKKSMNKSSFKVIADYPNSDYKVGEILDRDWGWDGDDENGFNHHISHYPHLFKKITIEKNMITSEKLLKEIQDDAKECLRTLFVEPIPFDLDKWQTGKFNVQTRDGRKVEIFISADESNLYRIIGRISDCEAAAQTWTINGKYNTSGNEFPSDLFLIPKTKVKYINYFESKAFSSIEDALDAIKGNKGALYHLTFTGCKEVICNE